MKGGEEAEEEAKEEAEVAEEDEKEEEPTYSSSLHLLLLSSILLHLHLLLQPHLRYIPSSSLSLFFSFTTFPPQGLVTRLPPAPSAFTDATLSPSNHKTLSPIFSAAAML